MPPAAIFLIIVAVFAAFGMAVGQYVGEPAAATLAGAVIGIPMGLVAVTRRRRWLVTAVLVGITVLATYRLGLLGTAIVLLTFGLTVFICSSVLQILYGGNELDAFYQQITLMSGLIRSFVIVSNGRVVRPEGGESLLGPRQVLVRANSAVMMERGSSWAQQPDRRFIHRGHRTKSGTRRH